MDPNLYEAIKASNIEVLRQHKGQLGVQLTANNSTVLHVAVQFYDNDEFVQVILNLQPSLLCQVNSKGETALHIAARNGHSNSVRVLIEHAKSIEEDPENRVQIGKEMIWMTNEHRDTAMHEAVRNNHLDVVKMLVREDAVFPRVVNNFGETPLYIAAKKDCLDTVSTILDVCISPAHSGPHGRTALHAAVIAGSPECTKKILEKKPNLMKETDLDGWTPLHYAAYRNNVPCAAQLLEADKSTAYDRDEEKQTALHIAAREGHTDIMKELLSHCPDCWEIVNGKGQNILHIAKEHEKEGIINFIRRRSVKDSWFSNLENQMDYDGNTPFNLSAASDKGSTSVIKDNKPEELMFHSTSFNLPVACNTGSTSTIRSNEPKEVETEDYNSTRDAHLVVAALIATVTFTAGLTLPGGFHSNEGPDQGTALLVRNAAFKAFVITNALAMALSVDAIFVCIFPLYTGRPGELKMLRLLGFGNISYATVTMMIAFMTGSYAVLSNSSDLAVGVLIIENIFLLPIMVLAVAKMQEIVKELQFDVRIRGVLRKIMGTQINK